MNNARFSEEIHDRGLNDFEAIVTDISWPTPSILRFSALLEGSGANPEWQKPNVAVRFYVDDWTRVYTVRSFDPHTDTAVIDVVQHANPSPMMTWSREVEVGDRLTISGPRPHFIVPDGPRALVFADETAIPAVYSIFKQWPQGVTAEVFISAPDQYAFKELPTVSGVRFHYLEPGVQPGEMPLAEAARAVESPADYVVWASGERDEMREIRRFFRREVGLPKESVAVFGYWKKGTSTAVIDERRKKIYLAALAEGRSLDPGEDVTLDD